MQTFTRDEFWAELEQLGEDAVRERVITGKFGSGNKKLPLAEEWLRLKEKSRSDAAANAAHDLDVETVRVAKSARDAAWVAAGCAVIAVIISLVALYFSKGGNG